MWFINFRKLILSTENGIIKSDSVARAMLAVDRSKYCPYAPYTDSPQSIGYSATISAPHMVPINKIIYFYFIQYSDI